MLELLLNDIELSYQNPKQDNFQILLVLNENDKVGNFIFSKKDLSDVYIDNIKTEIEEYKFSEKYEAYLKNFLDELLHIKKPIDVIYNTSDANSKINKNTFDFFVFYKKDTNVLKNILKGDKGDSGNFVNINTHINTLQNNMEKEEEWILDIYSEDYLNFFKKFVDNLTDKPIKNKNNEEVKINALLTLFISSEHLYVKNNLSLSEIYNTNKKIYKLKKRRKQSSYFCKFCGSNENVNIYNDIFLSVPQKKELTNLFTLEERDENVFNAICSVCYEKVSENLLDIDTNKNNKFFILDSDKTFRNISNSNEFFNNEKIWLTPQSVIYKTVEIGEDKSKHTMDFIPAFTLTKNNKDKYKNLSFLFKELYFENFDFFTLFQNLKLIEKKIPDKNMLKHFFSNKTEYMNFLYKKDIDILVFNNYFKQIYLKKIKEKEGKRCFIFNILENDEINLKGDYMNNIKDSFNIFRKDIMEDVKNIDEFFNKKPKIVENLNKVFNSNEYSKEVKNNILIIFCGFYFKEFLKASESKNKDYNQIKTFKLNTLDGIYNQLQKYNQNYIFRLKKKWISEYYHFINSNIANFLDNNTPQKEIETLFLGGFFYFKLT